MAKTPKAPIAPVVSKFAGHHGHHGQDAIRVLEDEIARLTLENAHMKEAIAALTTAANALVAALPNNAADISAVNAVTKTLTDALATLTGTTVPPTV